MKSCVKNYLSIIFTSLIYNLFLDLEEELFKAKERIIEISLEKDFLYDSVTDLEMQLFESCQIVRKLEKQLRRCKKLRNKCTCHF